MKPLVRLHRKENACEIYTKDGNETSQVDSLVTRHSAISASGKDHGWSIDDWELIGAAGL
jgi:hypothetical protein